jgi:hypothetical protein
MPVNYLFVKVSGSSHELRVFHNDKTKNMRTEGKLRQDNQNPHADKSGCGAGKSSR